MLSHSIVLVYAKGGHSSGDDNGRYQSKKAFVFALTPYVEANILTKQIELQKSPPKTVIVLHKIFISFE